MAVLTDHKIPHVYHYAPLHYLLFLARSRALFSKAELVRRGFPESHFRSTSWRQDRARGFSEYVHLTTMEFPEICRAKLSRGFPHFTVGVPSAVVDECGFDLCRYNIAKNRYLRKDGVGGLREGPANGYYYDGKQIPIARGSNQCAELLRANHGVNMIEVLVPNGLILPDETVLVFHDPEDLKIAEALLRLLKCPWKRSLAQSEHRYVPSGAYRKLVTTFLERSFGDPNWKGDGLEFDRV